jgi:hypothetical protein
MVMGIQPRKKDTMSEILEERNGYRVRLVQDESPDAPYYDGQSPLLRMEYCSGAWRSEHIDSGTLRPRDNDSAIEEAASRWGTDFPKLEKYLRAYYGATQVEEWYSGDYWYITYDSRAFRDAVGAPAGSADMTEYRAYVEGNGWGYIVEKQVHWSTEDDYPDRDSWEEVESCWGFYGLGDCFETTAREAFKAYAGDESGM